MVLGWSFLQVLGKISPKYTLLDQRCRHEYYWVTPPSEVKTKKKIPHTQQGPLRGSSSAAHSPVDFSHHSADQLISRLEGDCAEPRLHHWLSAELDSTVGDRAFPAAAARVWNSLPQHVSSAPSLHVYASRLKTHFFSVSFPEQFWMWSACEVTSSLLDTYLLTRTSSPGHISHPNNFPSAVKVKIWKLALTHTPDPNRSTAINFVRVNGRSLYIGAWWWWNEKMSYTM